MTHHPVPLWQPTPDDLGASRMAGFREFISQRTGAELPDYAATWEWSVANLGTFWSLLAEFFEVRFHSQPAETLASRGSGSEEMPGPRWFPGATLNYAEHALRHGEDHPEALALQCVREDGRREEFTYGQLRAAVAACRSALVAMGVSNGDRVAAVIPTSAHSVIAMLATASLGAIWSACSPDFGPRAIADRFIQIEPTVLIAVDGYRYGGKTYSVTSTVEQLRRELPGLRGCVRIDYLGEGGRTGEAAAALEGTQWHNWDALLAEHVGAELAFAPVDFEHPLWILYSSGTTGLPKGIVHSHGGITLEHLKALGLHCGMGPGEVFLWFTTTGWMMWNFLVAGLLTGATLVLYDGSPGYPGQDVLWNLADEYGITFLGVSASYIQACRKQGMQLGAGRNLSRLRTIGVTGSPLDADGFRWLASELGERTQIASLSGGTDVCTGFVGTSPDVPVWEGEISCRWLGVAADAYDEQGNSVRNQVAELVITRPMPSMPVFFWNDPDGQRLRGAYFDTYPGIWRHGDWVLITQRDSVIIYGRSDSTLNRGGVRLGTAEFYRVAESLPEVADSLVVDTGGTNAQLLCFVVLAPGAELTEVERLLKAELRSQLSPRHAPDRVLAIPEVPRTLNGKKVEVPVKRILSGAKPANVLSRDALANPDSLAVFADLHANELSDQGAKA